MLTGDDQATDPDLAGLAIGKSGIRDRSQSIEGRPEERDHLAAGIEPDYPVGIAEPFRFGDRWQLWGFGRRKSEAG